MNTETSLCPARRRGFSLCSSISKTTPLQVLHGRLFGMPQGKTNMWLHVLIPVLCKTITHMGKLPSRSVEELARRLEIKTDPPLFAMTEQSDPFRARNPKEQRLFYSGKKKRHTIKNLLLIGEEMHILFLSETHPGKIHDKAIADSTPYPLPGGSYLMHDLGFLAFELDGVDIIMPHKKPGGQELTAEQKEENRMVSSLRVRIEHVISSIKRCRMAKETIRLLKERRQRFGYGTVLCSA